MSRNMINTHIKVFDMLKDFVLSNEANLEINPSAVRYISCNDSEEKILKNLIIDSRIPVYSGLLIAFCTHNDTENNVEEKYFVITGKRNFSLQEEFLQEIDLNAGFATCLIGDLEIPIKDDYSHLNIVNEILFLYKGSSSELYTGHNFSDIIKPFEHILVFKILPNCPIKFEDSFKFSCFACIKNKKKILLLPFSDKLTTLLEDLIFENETKFPFENTFYALNSTKWEYVFLEFYRCVEKFFPIVLTSRLYADLGLGIDVFEFSNKIEGLLNWKAKEDQAIKSIFNDLPKEMTRILTGITNENLGKWYYGLRNKIVHHRKNESKISITDKDWNQIMEFSINLIDFLYKKYSKFI